MSQTLPSDSIKYTPVAESHNLHFMPKSIIQVPYSHIDSEVDIKRSVSSPQMHDMVQGDDTGSPSGDKRRNKLGYQRTTVACGHCRRRKIRCLLPTPEDSQGRCINCIRLKKECHFHAVDHIPDLRPARKDSSTGLSPVSSSPHTPVGPSSLSHLDSSTSSPFDQPALIPSALDDLNPAFTSGSRSLSMPYMTGGSSNYGLQPSFTLSNPDDPSEWAHFPSFPPQLPHHPSSSGSQYWASGENTPNTSTFPRHMIQPPSAFATNSPVPFAHGSHSWAPSRSGSFSGFENLQHNYTYPELQPHSEQATPTLSYGIESAGSSTPSGLGHNSPAHFLPEQGLTTTTSLGYGAQPQSWLPPESPWFAEPGGIIGSTDGLDSGRDPYSTTSSPRYPSRSSAG